MDFKSKFHFWKVYFMITFGTILFFGLGYLLMFEIQRKPGDSSVVMFAIGSASIVFGIYLIFIYIKQLPVIRVDYTGVKLHSLLGEQYFAWSDVKSVKYTGKDSFQFAFGFTMETMVVRLKDGRSVKIFYEHYSNGYLMQQYFRSYIEHQHAPVLIEEKVVMPNELTGESFKIYRGIPLLSFRGISIWGFILCMLVVIMKEKMDAKAVMPISILCLFWYAINSYFCFYIKMSDNYLIIKNYFVPFVGEKYRLSDIQEMAVETYPKWPKCLRVITNSFHYRIFPCGPIRNSEWKAFIGTVHKKGIQIRNETI